MIDLYCQHCGHPLKIPDKYAGQSGTCKNCGKQILVPAVGFEPGPTPAPTQKTKDIPYKWIGATAAVMAVLAIGVYAMLSAGESTPPPAANVDDSTELTEVASLDDEPQASSVESLLDALYSTRLDEEKRSLAASDNPLHRSISEIMPNMDENEYLEIPWRTDLLAARRESNETGKPIFMWVMDGHPLGST